MNNWKINKTVDLARGIDGIEVWPHALLVTGDKNAHEWNVTVMDNGKAASLDGIIQAYFVRSDGATVTATGSVSGNVATVTLPEACYAYEGDLQAVMQLLDGDVSVTLSALLLRVRQITTDVIIDPGTEIPSLDDLLAQIESMKQATKDATTATTGANAAKDAANTAASSANSAASAANASATKADTATANANTATERANAAADEAEKIVVEKNLATKTSVIDTLDYTGEVNVGDIVALRIYNTTLQRYSYILCTATSVPDATRIGATSIAKIDDVDAVVPRVLTTNYRGTTDEIATWSVHGYQSTDPWYITNGTTDSMHVGDIVALRVYDTNLELYTYIISRVDSVVSNTSIRTTSASAINRDMAVKFARTDTSYTDAQLAMWGEFGYKSQSAWEVESTTGEVPTGGRWVDGRPIYRLSGRKYFSNGINNNDVLTNQVTRLNVSSILDFRVAYPASWRQDFVSLNSYAWPQSGTFYAAQSWYLGTAGIIAAIDGEQPIPAGYVNYVIEYTKRDAANADQISADMGVEGPGME